jgi:hypothetical protein
VHDDDNHDVGIMAMMVMMIGFKMTPKITMIKNDEE